jgi:membrane protease YdiL (CAAX protease family)
MTMITNLNTKRILIFIAFAFGIPWAAALVISLFGMRANNAAQAVGLANTIFITTPWLASIATRLVTGEGWGNLWLRPNFKRGWRFYLAVWLLPLLATIVGGAIFYLLFPQSFDSNLGVVRKLVESSPSASANPWSILLSISLSMMFISALINTIVSMGEEFGWRGYLLPKLVDRFSAAERTSASPEGLAHAGTFHPAGARKAALLTGVIHGVWHWPLILMTMGLVPGVSFLTPLVYLVFTCSLSILLSWGTLRSGSVWPAALGHGTANAASALPGYLLNGAAIPLIGPDVTGLVGGIGYVVLALVLLFNRRAFAGGTEASAERAEPVPASA